MDPTEDWETRALEAEAKLTKMVELIKNFKAKYDEELLSERTHSESVELELQLERRKNKELVEMVTLARNKAEQGNPAKMEKLSNELQQERMKASNLFDMVTNLKGKILRLEAELELEKQKEKNLIDLVKSYKTRSESELQEGRQKATELTQVNQRLRVFLQDAVKRIEELTKQLNEEKSHSNLMREHLRDSKAEETLKTTETPEFTFDLSLLEPSNVIPVPEKLETDPESEILDGNDSYNPPNREATRSNQLHTPALDQRSLSLSASDMNPQISLKRHIKHRSFDPLKNENGSAESNQNKRLTVCVTPNRQNPPQTLPMGRNSEHAKTLSPGFLRHSDTKERAESSPSMRLAPTTRKPRIVSLVLSGELSPSGNEEDAIYEGEADARVIRAATLPILVEAIVSPNQHKMLYEFLLTYRSFCKPQNFLEELIKKFDEATNEVDHEKTISQLRISAVLKNWIGNYWFDFSGDSELLNMVNHFIEHKMKPQQPKASTQLLALISSKVTEGEDVKIIKHHMTGRAPDPIIPKIIEGKPFVITDANPLEVARQLTLLEYNIYKKIRPSECLNQAWNKEGKEKNAPNILAMISRFNEVSNWVATQIIQVKNNKFRPKVIQFFIEVAEKCYQMNNLNAMLEIISGLNQSSVNRLKETWAAVGSKQIQNFETLNALVSNKFNYKVLREHISHLSPPCVPYLGIYLTDLIFVTDGNPDFVTDKKLINFDKRRRLAHVIHEITQFQHQPYVLQMVSVILKYLKKLEFLDEETLYTMSIQIQPRAT